MPTREEELDSLLASMTTAAVNVGRRWRDPAVRGALREEVERVTAWRRADRARQDQEEIEARGMPAPAEPPAMDPPCAQPPRRSFNTEHVRLPYKDD